MSAKIWITWAQLVIRCGEGSPEKIENRGHPKRVIQRKTRTYNKNKNPQSEYSYSVGGRKLLELLSCIGFMACFDPRGPRSNLPLPLCCCNTIVYRYVGVQRLLEKARAPQTQIPSVLPILQDYCCCCCCCTAAARLIVYRYILLILLK